MLMVRLCGAAKQEEMPVEFKSMLSGFEDIMSKELLAELPPRHEVEHEIDFIPGSVSILASGPRRGASTNSRAS